MTTVQRVEPIASGGCTPADLHQAVVGPWRTRRQECRLYGGLQTSDSLDPDGAARPTASSSPGLVVPTQFSQRPCSIHSPIADGHRWRGCAKRPSEHGVLIRSSFWDRLIDVPCSTIFPSSSLKMSLMALLRRREGGLQSVCQCCEGNRLQATRQNQQALDPPALHTGSET
jgi:hypothetical protein